MTDFNKPFSPADANADDPRRPLRRALRYGFYGLIAVTVFSLALWGALRGLPGIWGVVVGAAIGGGFVLATAASVLLTAHTSPTTTQAVVLGGWLLKMVVLLIVMLGIRDMDFYDHLSLFATIVLVLLAVLGSEVWGIMTSKMTYAS